MDPDYLEQLLSGERSIGLPTGREVWKLGCRWGTNKPSYFEMLLKHGIAVSGADKPYQPGTLLVIADGFKVQALGELLEELRPCTSNPSLEADFNKYEIPFEEYVIYGPATIYILPEEDRFEYKNQIGISRINDQATRQRAISLWENRNINYWVFQGNPSIYDFDAAIRENRLTDWLVTSHKDKIKAGDKAIIWLTGKQTGCYALADITTDPKNAAEFAQDEYWLEEKSTDLKVGIRITHNLWSNPIPAQKIKETEGLRDLKAGTQGTNFSATRAQYQALLNLINPQANRTSMASTSSKIDLPLNAILYGPPGTGKTYQLVNYQKEWFTDAGHRATTEEILTDRMAEHSVWQVIAAILYIKDAPLTANEIWDHPLMKAKISPETKKPQATIWRNLLSYADRASTNLDDKYRGSYQLFMKSEGSRWQILPEMIEEIPSIIDQELLDMARNPVDIEVTVQTPKSRFSFITFHQKYSYEDFIEGIRPLLQGDEEQDGDLKFELKKGIFYESCIEALKLAGYDSFAACYKDSSENRKARFAEASGDPQKQYAIFIDEINRANISAVFGELITLLEDDKRIGAENEMWVELPYSKEKFSVPGNLYVIGTMNTADRSIALLDIALRRRFEFRALYPEYHDGAWWSPLLRNLNEAIYLRKKNPDFFIGHAFFIKSIPSDRIRILNNRIIPLLYEYCQNNADQVRQILDDAQIPFQAGDINANYRILAV